MIRVVLADDHPVYREGIRRVLERTPDMQVVGETASGDDIAALAREHQADVVLLDVTMPGRGYLAVLKELRETAPRARALVVSGHDESEYAVPSLRGGAAGYFEKSHGPWELVDAIRRVHAGRTWVSPDVAGRLATGLGSEGGEGPPHHKLSARELEVLVVIAQGVSLKEIAARMDISPKTVSSYRARILEKLGVTSNAELVRYALQHELISRQSRADGPGTGTGGPRQP